MKPPDSDVGRNRLTSLGHLHIVAVLVCALFFANAHAASLNVYTERQPIFLQHFFDGFEREAGIQLNILYLDKGVIERLRNEGEHSPADVVIVADISRLSQLVANGLSQPIESDVVDQVVPSSLRHPEGLWVGLSKRYRVVFVPKDASGGPKDFSELGESSLRGKVCIRSGSHPYNVALFSAYVNHHGEEATEQWLRGLKGNLARKPQGNDRAQIRGVASGSCDMAVANLYYYFKMLLGDDLSEANAAKKVKWLPVVMGAKGVHTNISGIAIAKHSKNAGGAHELVEYMLSAESQLLYAAKNNELPVREIERMPRKLQEAHRTKADDLSLQAIVEKRPLASELVEKVGFDD